VASELRTPEAHTRFKVMASARETVLTRARKASGLTIPGLVPEEGQNEHQTFSQPYQSLGARCVAHLSSALMLALFPAGVPFFRLNIDEQVVAQLGTEVGEVSARLAVLARTVHNRMEASALRAAVPNILRHLVVAGNILAYCPEKGSTRVFRIDQYVVRRDANGDPVEIVVCEKVSPLELADNVRAAVGLAGAKPGDEKVDLYTHVFLDGDNQVWRQEIKGSIVPDSEGTSPRDKSPWLALRWQTVPGSDYGRSHVTEYIGDFLSLEDLYKSMVEFAAIAARVVYLVDPNAGIDIEELAAAESGDFLTGYKDRIQTLQLDKFNDWRVMADLAERLERRLAAAFLLTTAVTRNAERVTAEEIRLVAQELENVLGGTYTVLASEMQLPLVRRYMYLSVRAGSVPDLPPSVQPVITTGFDALGRAHSVNRIRSFVADLVATLGPQVASALLNGPELAKRLGEGHGVDGLTDLLKSPEQLQQEQTAAQQGAAVQAAVPEIAKAAATAAQQP
jgi:hypothetical protein